MTIEKAKNIYSFAAAIIEREARFREAELNGAWSRGQNIFLGIDGRYFMASRKLSKRPMGWKE